jgi:transcription factor IIIB subunit 2
VRISSQSILIDELTGIGNRYINQLARALTIPESASKAAGQVFKLAVGLNFIQGRRTKTVAAVCLYIACRRQDGNTVMLIDFADVLMVSIPRAKHDG